MMARNKRPGDNRQKRAVKARSQTPNPITGTWIKRGDKSGKFLDVKADPKPFKGVRKEGRWPKASDKGGDFVDFGNIQVVDPAVRPKRMKVETIRKAVRKFYQ